MSLPFDPNVPLAVPADLAETHVLKTVKFRGMDVVARLFVIREADGVADGPYVNFYHYGQNKPSRAGIYVDGKPGPVWHTFHSDGRANTVERSQDDGSVVVEGVKGKPVPVLGVMRPHPDTGKPVKDGWWHDMDGRDALYVGGVEQRQWRTALPKAEKQYAKGGIAAMAKDSNTGNVLNSLTALQESGAYTPTASDAAYFCKHHLDLANVETLIALYGSLGQPFVDALLAVAVDPAEQSHNTAHVAYVLHRLDVEWPVAADPLLCHVRDAMPLAKLLGRLDDERRFEVWKTHPQRRSVVALVPRAEALDVLAKSLDYDNKYNPTELRAGLEALATAEPTFFLTWADAFLRGPGKKAKGRAAIVEVLGAVGAAAVPLIVQAATESNADVRWAGLLAIKALGSDALEGLQRASKKGSAKLKSTAARLLRDQQRRLAAEPPESVTALGARIEAEADSSGVDAVFEQVFPIRREGGVGELLAVGSRARRYHRHGVPETWFEEASRRLHKDHPEMVTLSLRIAIGASEKRGFRGDLNVPEAGWYLDQLPCDLDRIVSVAVEKKDPQAHLGVLLEGLATPSKKVRKKVVDALASLGETVVPELLRHLERDIESQQAAAAVLLRIADPRAAQSLQEALKAAPDKATKTALDEALLACGGPVSATPDDVAGKAPAAPAATADRDWEAVLMKAKKGRALKWLPVAQLSLALSDGTALSDNAILGLITLLRKEHERPDPTVWALRDHLDPESAHQFGRELYNQWRGPGKASAAHKWAVYAIAPFVDHRSLTRVGPTLDDLSSGGRHAHAGWLLEVFGRSKDPAGMDWVGYWADHGMTRTVTKTSSRLVEQEARRRGLSVPEFKQTLDGWIAAKGVEDDLPAQARRVPQTLEQAMIGGRTWSAVRFQRLQQESAWTAPATGLVFDLGGVEALLTGKGFEDASGKAVAVPEDGQIRLLHPLEIADLTSWAGVKHQPFEQLNRSTFAVTDALDVPATPVKPLLALRLFSDSFWRRGSVEDAGWSYSNWMRLASRGVARFELHHSGIHAGDPSFGEPVKADSYSIQATAGGGTEPRDLDPIAFSELQRAIYAVFPPGRATSTSGVASSSNLNMSSGFPTADLAPSNRAKCIMCGEKIVKGDIRVVVEREVSTPYFTGKKPAYLHPACSAEFATKEGFALDDVVATALAHTDLTDDVEASMRL